ncbi:MAG: hypothetical protein ACTHOD_05630 [Motilibacteraceae bacterium]
MSQTTFPFAPPQAPEQQQDESPKKDNRLLFVLLGVLGLAVIGAAAWFFLLSGGSSDQAASAPVARPKPKPAASASPSASAAPTPAPTALDASVGVDPFKALADKPSASTAPSNGLSTNPQLSGQNGTTSQPGGTTTGGQLPSLPAPVPAPAPTGSTTGGTSGTTAQPQKPPFLVQYLKATSDGKSVWIGVNGTPYLTKVGSVFDTYFKVTALAGGCATVQYGDVVGGKACTNQALIIP